MNTNEFRVWDKTTKTMHTENSGFFLFTNGVLGFNSGNSWDIVDKKDFQIMFWQGAKDKNGKKVFPNDIVKERYHPLGANDNVIEYYGIYLIVENNGAIQKLEGTNVLNEEKKEFHHKTVLKKYNHPTLVGWVNNSFKFERAEKLGNIFQNPELLETVKK